MMKTQQLETIARQLVAPGKGILAADKSYPTIEKRFKSIKVDKGAKALAGFAEEKVTEGLDGLRDRLKEYVQLGARFTKWRAVITIGPAAMARLDTGNTLPRRKLAQPDRRRGFVSPMNPNN